MRTAAVRSAIGLLIFMLVVAVGIVPACAKEFDQSPWDRTLKRFVTEAGRVDYAAQKADPADLDSYVAAIAERSPLSAPADVPTCVSPLAYWINAYNSLVMKGVIDHWPVKSVRDIGLLPFSFFWRQKFVTGGKEYTLDAIEDILRKKLAEPRIHFAIVCASNNCPRLRREAYTPENTDRLLDAAARFYLNEPRNFRVDAARNRVTLPFILRHYPDM